VVAVANLAELNWQPALFFALEAVKAEEKKAGVPIYLDLTGALSRPPWSLSTTTSTVMVLDRGGRPVFQASGRLTAAQQDELFAAITAQL
jgi:predicted transcriptional regulator